MFQRREDEPPQCGGADEHDEGPKPDERPCCPGRVSGGLRCGGGSFGLGLGELKTLRGHAVLVLALSAVQLRLCPGVAHALGAAELALRDRERHVDEL